MVSPGLHGLLATLAASGVELLVHRRTPDNIARLLAADQRMLPLLEAALARTKT